jgi:hypothetical protein
VLSRNSHFSLQLGHWFGCASESNVYPQLEHFQLGMVTPPGAGPERAGRRMARLHFDPPEEFPAACSWRGPQARQLAVTGNRQARVISGVFKNKHQAVSQGVRRFGKRSLLIDR